MPLDEKVDLDFVTIAQRLDAVEFPAVERVIGIATGGIVPASLVAFKLKLPLSLMTIHYRNPDNSPLFERPRLLAPLSGAIGAGRVLLVDDVSVTGQTLALARAQLVGCDVTTFALKGTADIVLFPEIAACVNWPWL